MKNFKLNIEKKEVSIPFCVNSVTHTPLEGISGHLWFGSDSCSSPLSNTERLNLILYLPEASVLPGKTEKGSQVPQMQGE